MVCDSELEVATKFKNSRGSPRCLARTTTAWTSQKKLELRVYRHSSMLLAVDTSEGRSHLKRKRSETPSTWNDDLSVYAESYDASAVDDLDEERAVEERERVRKRARNLSFVATAIYVQLDSAPHNNVKLWLKHVNSMTACDDIDALADDLRTKEAGRVRTQLGDAVLSVAFQHFLHWRAQWSSRE
ncbi:hypothetical protein EXIGLDRAFT_695914 [Exidia glandulosa HHB12029]|uniref:Uncharacterized protein n=1 Tax=Exidia glandulosa HHB12029 TaxID=1314781 RepID=A0A165QEY1_EXIGL|nr:hypothetical protein EXIGLDRAFT_695914 [Exidia glandulosa HHB12029]